MSIPGHRYSEHNQEAEDELIRRWLRGERSAFEALVRRWQQPIARFLTHYTGDATLVEDLCQEVFLRVHLARDRYRNEGAFSTWIYHIARNVARDAARRQSCRPRVESWLEKERMSAPNGTVESWEQKETGEMVAAALAALPEPLRLVVVLRHYEKMSFADMARLLNTPASTLKSRFTTALSRLRTELQQRGWQPEEQDS